MNTDDIIVCLLTVKEFLVEKTEDGVAQHLAFEISKVLESILEITDRSETISK